MTATALKHVLLIDDSEDDNFFHERAISRSGLEVRTSICRDGAEAVELLRQCTQDGASAALPQVIFLDINMPKMTGWEFLEAYAKLPQEALKDISVIMLSASMDPLDRDRAIESPLVTDFLTKPLTPAIVQEIARDFTEGDVAQ
ncbi:MAG: response regulator [Gammaproteobacteria bacterium]